MVIKKEVKKKKNNKNKTEKTRKKVLIVKRKTPMLKQKIKKRKLLKAVKKGILSKKKKTLKLTKKKLVKKTSKKKIVTKNKVSILKRKKPAKAAKSAKRKVVRAASPVLKTEIDTFSPKGLFKAKIKVVGIGGGGGSIVSEIGKSLNKATFMIADTDIRALKKKSGIKYFWFGEEFTHGLGTGVDPDLARNAAKKEKEKIAEFFKGQDIVVFIASLGGGLGSGATEVFIEAAKESDAITFGIFTLPFKFEGKKKEKIAKNALRKIRESLNISIAIPNEKIFKVIDNNTPIVQAFSIVNKNLADSLESLIDLIYSPGLINIDFADVSTILNGKGNLAFLNSVESSGKNRTEELMKKIIYNPLYQNNNFTAEKILFNIAGDNSLSMFEVEKISKSISEINPGAKIIFGVSKNSKLKNKIKATLLMAGPSKESNQLSHLPAEKENEKQKEEQLPKKPFLKEKKAKTAKTKRNKKNRKLSAEKKEERTPFVIPPALSELNRVPIVDVDILNQEKESSVLASKSDIESEEFFYGEKSIKKTIRRSALEIKKAEAIEENKRFLQEKEWEIPAFLRKVKPEH
jgi:cell division protein FtsZ